MIIHMLELHSENWEKIVRLGIFLLPLKDLITYSVGLKLNKLRAVWIFPDRLFFSRRNENDSHSHLGKKLDKSKKLCAEPK